MNLLGKYLHELAEPAVAVGLALNALGCGEGQQSLSGIQPVRDDVMACVANVEMGIMTQDASYSPYDQSALSIPDAVAVNTSASCYSHDASLSPPEACILVRSAERNNAVTSSDEKATVRCIQADEGKMCGFAINWGVLPDLIREEEQQFGPDVVIIRFSELERFGTTGATTWHAVRQDCINGNVSGSYTISPFGFDAPNDDFTHSGESGILFAY